NSRPPIWWRGVAQSQPCNARSLPPAAQCVLQLHARRARRCPRPIESPAFFWAAAEDRRYPSPLALALRYSTASVSAHIIPGKVLMQAIEIENPGPDYRLKLGNISCPTPGPDQVLIKVAAAGVNRADLHQGRGSYPPPPGAPETLGMEVAGHVVEDSGPYKKGDAVCALLGGGGYAEYAAADVASILPVPASLDLVDAASLPEALFTAWTNVVDTCRLKPGETLLVHGGTSGIGVIAIQMFAALGHTVFATAGSEEKCALCGKLGAK